MRRPPAKTVRICLVYDCLFPHTVGGAERWYRNLAERLAADGHEVTYLTLRQWPRGAPPAPFGVNVRAVGPRLGLYTRGGRRRMLPPVLFGLGVLAHLLRHGRRYEILHTASFPFFSLLAIALVRPLARYRIVVDWHEVWTREYWREYLGLLGGEVGWRVQRACARVRQRAFCFSGMHRSRLLEVGLRGALTKLSGEYRGPLEPRPGAHVEPLVVFAGRHIPEKRVTAIPPALAHARVQLPELRAAILGDGPERRAAVGQISALGLQAVVDAPGFVSCEQVDQALARAMCMLLPSRREGYGLVVIEAAAHGTPSIVVAEPDNAAVELVIDGENGFVAPSASPSDLARAIARVHADGAALRASTAAWFAGNASRLSIESALAEVLDAYRREAALERKPAAGVGR